MNRKAPAGAVTPPERGPRIERMPTVDIPKFSADAPPPPEPYAYPTPVELARLRAEREATPAAYGGLGGLVTLGRHGPEHFRRMARKRWGREAVAPGRPCSGCSGRFPGKDLTEVGDDCLTYFEGDELCRSCADAAGVA